MLHEHNIIDNDVHFIISDTGEINLLSDNKDSIIYIQQFLHLSESFTFEAPRYIEGHDMSLSNIVNIHFTNIDSKTKEESKDIYPVDGLKVDEQDENKIIFTCKLKDTCTRYVGLLKFSIIFECYEDDVVIYRWPTDIFSKIMIRRTNYNSESIVIEHSDIISEIQNDIKNIKSEFNNIGKSSIPDWNQNDPSSVDYIKNRPFYEGDNVETELFDVCSMVDNNSSSWVQLNSNIFGIGYDINKELFFVPALTIGDRYIIKYNGSTYECIALNSKEIIGVPGGIFITNIDDLTSKPTSGVYIVIAPYSLLDSSDTSGRFVIFIAQSFNDTAPTELKVIGNKREIVKIDPKYIEFPEETDPTVPNWAKQAEKPSYTASEVGADTTGTAESKVSEHNVSDTAHNDIRLLIQNLTEENAELKSEIDQLKQAGTGSGSGVTVAQSNSLWAIIQKAAFAEVLTDEELNDFKTAWGITTENIPATGISLDKITLSFTTATTQTLTATVEPSNSTDKVTWESSNIEIATVSGGVVTPVSNGSCTITAKAGSYSASCEVTVAVESEIVTYTIMNNLTNVSTDNPSTSVKENGGYTANLTASDGYLLESVIVTMGGVDITSSAYANGVVTISGVTGNVVITAIASEVQESDGVEFVEYIETDGTAYIDTEFIPEDVNWKYLIGVKYPKALETNTTFAGVSPRNKTSLAETDYWNFSFSSKDVNEYRTAVMVHGVSAILKTGDTQYDKDKDDSTVTRFTKKPVYIFSTNGSQKLYTDENMQTQPKGGTFMAVSANTDFTTVGDFSNDKHPITSMWLGGNNASGLSTPTYAPIILYCFKVWDENDTLLVDMHPAKKGLQVGMYDNVRQKFYGNSASSGVITCGEVPA